MAKLLTLDIGTTNWKAILFDENGNVIASSKIPTVISIDKYNNACYSHSLIWDSLCECIQNISSQGHTDVDAITVTSMGESVIPIDSDGNELCDIIPWFDTRSLPECSIFERELGRKKVFQITGLEIGAIFSLNKIAWMKKNLPEIYQKASKWLQVADYVNYKLSGQMVTDYSMASRTMALDINTNQWSEDMLKAGDIKFDAFPNLVKSGTIIGTLTKEASLACQLPQGIPIVMGGHDHPLATIAGNAFDGKRILNSSGTAEPYLYVSDKNVKLPQSNLGQRIGRHPDPSRYISWGGITSSGICIEWAVKRLGMCNDWNWKVPDISLNELFTMCDDIPCGSGGVLFTPYLRGSGAPNWNPMMKANFLGINDSTTSRHMLRSVLEGLSYQGDILVRMHEKLSGKQVSEICCVGGGSRGKLWMQIKADVTGKPVVTRQVDEATGQGAAILAAVGIGIFDSMEQGAQHFDKLSKKYIPDTHKHEIYRKIVPIFETVHDSIRETNENLHKFALDY